MYVTQHFVTSLVGCTAQADGSLVTAAGMVRWCALSGETGNWYLTSSSGRGSHPTTQASLDTFRDATASANGAYVAASGESYVFVLNAADWATAEPGTGPPPP